MAKTVYLGMIGDIIHLGLINIIYKEAKYSDLMVGLLANKLIVLIMETRNGQNSIIIKHYEVNKDYIVNVFDGIWFSSLTDDTSKHKPSIKTVDLSTPYKGEQVGIHKLSSDFYHHLCNEYEKIVADKPKLGYEYQLLRVFLHVTPIYLLNASDV